MSRIENQVAFNIGREINRIWKRRDVLWNLLQGYDPDGNPLEGTFQDNVDLIQDHINAAKNWYQNTKDFYDKHPSVMTAIASIFGVQVSTLINKILDIKNLYLSVEASLATATSLDDFTSFVADLEEDIPGLPVTDVEIPETDRRENIVNDLLDCAAYVLRDINPNNGNTMGMSALNRGQLAMKALNSIYNYSISDSNLSTVHQTARTSLQAATTAQDLTNIADYIDANCPKLPLMRRNWANG